MDAGSGTGLIWGVVMLVVLLSSLAARRLPVAVWLKYALAWVAIFTLLYGLVLFRDELSSVWDRARADLGGSVVEVRGERTVVRRSDDGHYWVDAEVDGRTVNFLIDSGATTTAISSATATALGLEIDRLNGPLVVMTANGPIDAWPTEVARMEVGGIVTENLPVTVSDLPDGVNLLGMNWLSRLKSWRVEGREMVLEP